MCSFTIYFFPLVRFVPIIIISCLSGGKGFVKIMYRLESMAFDYPRQTDFQKANLKYKYGNRHFWCRGYSVDTVGKNTAAIKTYIRNQLKEDLEYDQMSLVEYIDPFTGEPVKKNKK